MLHTYLYYQLRTTCFGACYPIFRETIALLAKEPEVFIFESFNIVDAQQAMLTVLQHQV